MHTPLAGETQRLTYTLTYLAQSTARPPASVSRLPSKPTHPMLHSLARFPTKVSEAWIGISPGVPSAGSAAVMPEGAGMSRGKARRGEEGEGKGKK